MVVIRRPSADLEPRAGHFLRRRLFVGALFVAGLWTLLVLVAGAAHAYESAYPASPSRGLAAHVEDGPQESRAVAYEDTRHEAPPADGETSAAAPDPASVLPSTTDAGQVPTLASAPASPLPGFSDPEPAPAPPPSASPPPQTNKPQPEPTGSVPVASAPIPAPASPPDATWGIPGAPGAPAAPPAPHCPTVPVSDGATLIAGAPADANPTGQPPTADLCRSPAHTSQPNRAVPAVTEEAALPAPDGGTVGSAPAQRPAKGSGSELDQAIGLDLGAPAATEPVSGAGARAPAITPAVSTDASPPPAAPHSPPAPGSPPVPVGPVGNGWSSSSACGAGQDGHGGLPLAILDAGPTSLLGPASALRRDSAGPVTTTAEDPGAQPD